MRVLLSDEFTVGPLDESLVIETSNALTISLSAARYLHEKGAYELPQEVIRFLNDLEEFLPPFEKVEFTSSIHAFELLHKSLNFLITQGWVNKDAFGELLEGIALYTFPRIGFQITYERGEGVTLNVKRIRGIDTSLNITISLYKVPRADNTDPLDNFQVIVNLRSRGPSEATHIWEPETQFGSPGTLMLVECPELGMERLSQFF